MATITHKLMLSTTEANLVGEVKVRQADDETQLFEVTVLENGTIKNFAGLKPFFCIMAREVTGQGVSEEPVTAYDDTKGTLKYTLSANAMQMVGRNEAYFSFRKELTNGSWAEQFSTRSFFYTVEKSIYTQPFKDSNYWFTFKELYRLFNDYIESGKLTWEDFMDTESDLWKNFINQNREIIESVDPGGLVLTELIDSRKSGDTTYPSLADRLNNTDRQNNLVKSRLFFGDNNVLIGHRGCSGFAPESSKKAFELAYFQGMAGIETDLTNTSDGVIFCYHDETLDTKTDGTGNPRELTWDYVSTVKLTKAAGYDAYPNTKIATLDDYLSVAKKYNLIIFPEVALSTEDLIHEALDKIYLYGLQSQCVILVNKWNYQIVKSYAPNLIRCLIPSWGVANTADIDFCATNGIEICGAAFSAGLTAVPQSFIDYANEKGIYLYGYIINATKDLSRIKDLGIKFIGTDFFGGEK
ncbi:BppU family phage baseplate upper protein [Enterococcus sp. DIV1411a]|uniref:BppU family phage baseplate upper protein n=1 Tax=Enterococcus sp. DIV1411a TaxID=2774779 RepID=UPI003D300E77